MKRSHLISSLLTIFTIAIQLAACGVATPAQTVTSTAAPSLTPSAIPTSTELPATPSPTYPVPTLTSSAIPISSPPDGLHMAYIIDGNLYFQNGSNPPLQLTHGGNDWNILFFSENREKVFFLRGTARPFDLYSIDTDGSEERALVTNKLLRIADASYNESTSFHSVTIVPGTHYLLFSTDELLVNNTIFWTGDLLLLDTDTAKIKKFSNHAGSFYVSPDGKFIALDKRGTIDVIDLEGNIIRKNLLTYTPSEPSFLAPGICWMPNSQGLIGILPVPIHIEASASGSSYTVWHYALDTGIGTQVPLDILPNEVYMATVSQDGNWIIYNNNEQYAFYIGDIRTGNAQLYLPKTFVFHYERGWSLDNRHFIYSTPPGSTLYLGSVDSPPELIGKGDFLGWIDADRYLYYVDTNIVLGDITGSKEIIFTDRFDFQSPPFFTFIMP